MIKRLFNKINFKFIKILDQKSLRPLYKIILSSVILVSFFYLMPVMINYSKNKSFVFQNNSKAVLAYTLNNDGKDIEKGDAFLNENDLLKDIFSLNDLETDTVRLNASTIKQLFEDTEYSLKDVREKKLVKPVALTLLPAEIKMIENTSQRKDFFIQIILPLILQENNNIRLDRKRLFSIINKSNNTNLEKKWLGKNINSMAFHQEISLF